MRTLSRRGIKEDLLRENERTSRIFLYSLLPRCTLKYHPGSQTFGVGKCTRQWVMNVRLQIRLSSDFSIREYLLNQFGLRPWWMWQNVYQHSFLSFFFGIINNPWLVIGKFFYVKSIIKVKNGDVGLIFIGSLRKEMKKLRGNLFYDTWFTGLRSLPSPVDLFVLGVLVEDQWKRSINTWIPHLRKKIFIIGFWGDK